MCLHKIHITAQKTHIKRIRFIFMNILLSLFTIIMVEIMMNE
jgi:hypothetical protein